MHLSLYLSVRPVGNITGSQSTPTQHVVFRCQAKSDATSCGSLTWLAAALALILTNHVLQKCVKQHGD